MPGPHEKDFKKIKASEWVFGAEELVVRAPGEEDNSGSYRLNPFQAPSRIDCAPVGKDRQRPGIYRLEADTLTICVSGTQGGPRPTELAAEEGGKTVLITLKR